MSVRGKTLIISGASRGIGLSIALRAAKDGANVSILAKTTSTHPKLSGTIYSAAEAVEKAGGKALALQCDIRDEVNVEDAVKKTVEKFGGIDIVVNNASAISLTDTEHTSAKKYDLMNTVNTRGTWLLTKHALPYLRQSAKQKRNPHVLMLSPPLEMAQHWFAPHVAYTIAKYGMSMCVLGMSKEFKNDGIAVNALWPRTAIDTAAISNIVAPSQVKATRKPEIVADAAYVIFNQPSAEYTGNFTLDEEVLGSQGVTDFRHYQVDPQLDPKKLMPDFFVPKGYKFVTPKQKVLNSGFSSKL